MACGVTTMLLVASAAHAVNPPNPAPINAPILQTVFVPGYIVPPQVTATGPSADQLQPLGVVQPSVARYLADHRQYLYIKNYRTVSNNANDNPSGCAGQGADPIAFGTGTKLETFPVFALPGEMGLTYVMYYNTSIKGTHWSDNLSYALDTTCGYDPNNTGPCRAVMYYRADGSTVLFNGNPGVGPYTESGGGGVATLTYNASSATYALRDETATTKTFDVNGRLLSMADASGVGWTFSYTSGTNWSTVVTHTNGQSFRLGPGSGGAGTRILDPASNAYTLTGGTDASGNSTTTLTYPGTPTTAITFHFTSYSASPYPVRLTQVDYNGTPYSITSYVTNGTDPRYGWANGSHLAADSSEMYSISYSTDGAGNVQAQITNPLGHQSTQTYDGTNGSGGASNGYLSLVSDPAVITCGATTQGRSYDVNGHLAVTIDNNGNTHTYSYAANGQLQSETEGYGKPEARTTSYVWDPNQQLNRLLSETVAGWKKTSYTYTAQNRLASVVATNLSANGSANQTLTTTYNYVLYGNGMVQTMTVTRPSPSGSDTDTYSYDTLGNLTSLSDGLGHATTYSNYNGLGEVGHVVGPNGDATDYVYDGRGRVKIKTTYPYGTDATWAYGYDGFGLLYTLTAPDGQVTTWNRDATMRVQTITHNDKDGTSTESFTYDANGDVLEHKIVRGSTVGLDEVFHYDALGRVYQKIGQNGQSLTYAYDGNGNVLSVIDATGHTVSYQYDALNRVTQSSESGGGSPTAPTTAPTISVPSSSTSGAYTVSWSSITGATYYVLQEKVGSTWSQVQSSSALSWSPTGKATNTYSYQAKACNATGCGPWSSAATINVAIPAAPASAPSLSVPASSANGNYTVSWTSVANTSTYSLQQQVNGGAWTALQNNTSLSWSVTGKTNGTYGYRVQACNAIGCGPWSNTGTMMVTWPPVPATPGAMSIPAYSLTGGYTVSWGGVANAANYPLYQSVNGGAYTLVQNTASTSWTVSGEGDGVYSYLVSACDISGCSGQISGAVTVTIPTPIAMGGHLYTGVNIVTVSGNEGIGFDIAGGNTWEVFHTEPGNAHIVLASGPLPYGAATVQYTWTDAGVPAGMSDAGGSITSNQASSPVSVGSNPSTMYLTGTFNINGDHAHEYNLRVDFFNAGGLNVSSSTCQLVGEVTSNQ